VRRILVVALAILGFGRLAAQDVAGVLFDDRDGDGIHDAGEPGLSATVHLYGRTAGGGPVDLATATAADGSWSFAPGAGCYLVSVDAPADFRPGPVRVDGLAQGSAGYVSPVGLGRWGSLDFAAGHLDAGALRIAALGDSIAWNFNWCVYEEMFWYHRQLRSRLACVAPGASVQLTEAAVKGEHTDDLLVDDTVNPNNVFRIIELQPELITLSMIGNDLLDVDPGPNATQQQVNVAVAEVLDARRNLQEALSAFVSEVPDADVVLNTLYDNEAYACYSSGTGAFHRAWIPIVDQILRDLAWGQARPVRVAEVAAEFARQDLQGSCTGFDGLICRDIFQLDTIHPTNNGYTVVREKQWQGIGGANLGAGDTLGRPSITGVNLGHLRHVRRLFPTSHESRFGASVTDPAAALDDADGGAAAGITLGVGAEEFRVSGFPDWFDEIEIVRAIVGVRYHTTGAVTLDFYRIEASIDGSFATPPAYTPTSWNFSTPIVGGGGPNRPAENPDYPTARILAIPQVASDRVVSATLTKNPVLPPGAPDYEWPAVTHEELAATAVRVVAAPVAGTAGDDFTVELESAWIDLYGREKPRPAEVTGLRVGRDGSGLRLGFDESATADRYNVYFGRIDSVRAGVYDHGSEAPAGPVCDAAWQPAEAGRVEVVVGSPGAPGISAYILVTEHADGVESPAGRASDAVEIDRSQSICR